MTWKPAPREGIDPLTLHLDPQQGYLLSRLDGTLDVPTLAALMNLNEDQMRAKLDELVALGAVASTRPVTARVAPLRTEPSPEPGPERTDEVVTEDQVNELALATTRSDTHRKLFEQHLHHRPLDQRVAQARVAVEPDLGAWCFDPTTEVIRAVLENPRVGAFHARIIAIHHRTVAGLEALGASIAFTNDQGVRRALLQNPLLPPGLYRRLWSSRRLLDQYLVAISREATEQVRSMARDLLRTTFNQRTGEERVELILTTDGRCLASLAGATLDSYATALMCRRTYISTLLVQNIARWSAAPPPLIAHLRRQDLVKRNAALRQLLERHPNAT